MCWTPMATSSRLRRPVSQGPGPGHTRGMGEFAFPATRSDGVALELSLGVPMGWEAFDMMELPAEAASANPALGQRAATLARGIDAAGVIAIVGMGCDLPLESATVTQAFVTLTVALAGVRGAFPDSVPGGEVNPVEFMHPGGSYRGVRIRGITHVEVLPGWPPVPVRTEQFMVRTEHGVLVITFTTLQVELFDRLAALLEAIAGTCSLGRRTTATCS
jgi:hypothetical protein